MCPPHPNKCFHSSGDNRQHKHVDCLLFNVLRSTHLVGDIHNLEDAGRAVSDDLDREEARPWPHFLSPDHHLNGYVRLGCDIGDSWPKHCLAAWQQVTMSSPGSFHLSIISTNHQSSLPCSSKNGSHIPLFCCWSSDAKCLFVTKHIFWSSLADRRHLNDITRKSHHICETIYTSGKCRPTQYWAAEITKTNCIFICLPTQKYLPGN